MSTPKILIVCSDYYKELAEKQLASCVKIVEQSPYQYQIERFDAGTYEIPAVIQHYDRTSPFDAYIPLGLLLKGTTDHYEFIWEHVKECFIQFTLNGLILGNGIISAASMDVLTARVDKAERVQEAFNAVDSLLKLKKRVG